MTSDFKVADLSLAAFGRKEISEEYLTPQNPVAV